jgi:hypothetical protein
LSTFEQFSIYIYKFNMRKSAAAQIKISFCILCFCVF